ncbi:histidine phosphatase family protein [Burkholderia sp. JP2-270]|uniref:histidine phosphatase family protein n=1 Tax=Burkholderia sp. JP2-270 TaxID=2217913 RepID=UPI000DA2EC73|nr:histidine phosphatase family protein [Burkholderia sp. JP2-270]AWV05208.1 histidine phosphatase family protein [Burkholderia sp. JP2-270]
MRSLYLARHGQAAFGSDDYDRLTDVGVRQCARLGERLNSLLPQRPALAGGSHRRHLQSALACAEAWGPALAADCLVDAGFDEYDHTEILLRAAPQFPDLQALSAHVALQDDPPRAFQRMFADAAARWASGRFDGEYTQSWAAFANRCWATLTDLSARHDATWPVMAFTSGGVIGAICQRLLGIPDERIFDLIWSLYNGGLTRLLVDDDGHLQLGYLNCIAHLDTSDGRFLTYR